MSIGRVAYAALVGWWAALLLVVVAALLASTIVGMNRALMLLERLPQVGWRAERVADAPMTELHWGWRC